MELRQRLLFIVLLVVVVLVGYTILRPKPKPRAKVSTEQKTAIARTQTLTPKSTPTVAKQEVKAETLKPSQILDTATSKPVAVAEKPKEPISVSSKPSKALPTISEKPDTTKTLPAVSQKPITQPVTEEKEEKWGTDPFIRDWVLATEIKDLRLKAVTISGTKAYALINDQILEKGEVIMGKRIVQIERDKVILEQGGRQFTLFLGE